MSVQLCLVGMTLTANGTRFRLVLSSLTSAVMDGVSDRTESEKNIKSNRGFTYAGNFGLWPN